MTFWRVFQKPDAHIADVEIDVAGIQALAEAKNDFLGMRGVFRVDFDGEHDGLALRFPVLPVFGGESI